MSYQPSSGDITSVVIRLRGGTSITYYRKRDVVLIRKVTEDGTRIVDAEIPTEDFLKLCEGLIEVKTRA